MADAPDALDLRGRLKAVLEDVTPSWGRFKALEAQSGIPADSWKAVWYQRQRPSQEMLEYVYTSWPEMAFWLSTGVADDHFGHVAPSRGWTLLKPIGKPVDRTRDYFRHSIELSKKRHSGRETSHAEMAQLSELSRLRQEQLYSNDRAPESDGRIKLAGLLDEAKSMPSDDPLPLVVRLVRDLQQSRKWSDEGMAEALGMQLDLFLLAKGGAAEHFKAEHIGRIFDRWAYDALRNSMLKVLPKQMAAKLRELDVTRALR